MPPYKRHATPQKESEIEKQRREARAAADKARLAMAYEIVFSTPDGELVFEDLIKKTYVFASSFTGNSQGMFKQGKQAVGLYLLTMRDLDSPAGLRAWLTGKVRR